MQISSRELRLLSVLFLCFLHLSMQLGGWVLRYGFILKERMNYDVSTDRLDNMWTRQCCLFIENGQRSPCWSTVGMEYNRISGRAHSMGSIFSVGHIISILGAF